MSIGGFLGSKISQWSVEQLPIANFGASQISLFCRGTSNFESTALTMKSSSFFVLLRPKLSAYHILSANQ